jgi:hypothetical protein
VNEWRLVIGFRSDLANQILKLPDIAGKRTRLNSANNVRRERNTCAMPGVMFAKGLF